VSFAHARGDETLTFFNRLLAAIAVMGAVTVALTSLLARPLILLTFGAQYLAAEPLLVGYMAATMVLVLVIVFNSFYLARREGHFIPWLVAGTVTLVALLLIHHDSAQAIVVDILLAYSAILTAYVFQAAVAWLRARSARIDRASGQ
jgi:O-antigen/teichoic acid export membrane protein